MELTADGAFGICIRAVPSMCSLVDRIAVGSCGRAEPSVRDGIGHSDTQIFDPFISANAHSHCWFLQFTQRCKAIKKNGVKASSSEHHFCVILRGDTGEPPCKRGLPPVMNEECSPMPVHCSST